MKKLSLLMFAILILGCDTETPVFDASRLTVTSPTLKSRHS